MTWIFATAFLVFAGVVVWEMAKATREGRWSWALATYLATVFCLYFGFGIAGCGPVLSLIVAALAPIVVFGIFRAVKYAVEMSNQLNNLTIDTGEC